MRGRKKMRDDAERHRRRQNFVGGREEDACIIYASFISLLSCAHGFPNWENENTTSSEIIVNK